MCFIDSLFDNQPFFMSKEDERNYYINIFGIEYFEWLESQNLVEQE